MKRTKKFTAVVLGCMLLFASGCKSNADKSSSIVFDMTKTTGTVTEADPGKLVMTVAEDDENFKTGDNVVVTFQGLYLNSEKNESDVLEKIESVKQGDTVYVLYKEEERKDNVIKVEYAVKATK